MSIFKKLFGGFGSSNEEVSTPDIDLISILERIKKIEDANEIEPGRKIHSFHYGLLEIRTDRDITGHYRVTVWQGKERLYSFTVFAKKGEYETLKQAYSQINDFLQGDHALSSLPENDVLKGFFYGH